MPLSVVTASGPGTKSIFEKLNPFVDKLVGVYKQKKLNEWDNEWMSAMLADIEVAGNKKSIDVSILKKDPPEGYIDIEGMTKFADESMGMLAQKEAMMGGATEPTGQATSTELLPDPKEFNELYQFVSELPTGRVDWANTKGVFKERLESGRAMGQAAQSMLMQILGQQPVDQRAKFEQDFDLASKMKEELYPETEEAGIVFDPEQFKKDNPDMEISGYNSNTGGYTFKRKEEEEEGKPEIDFDKLNKFLTDNNMKLKGVSANPTTGNLNYTFGTKESVTPAKAKPTWEGNLAKAKQFTKDNPEFEITGTNPDSGSVTVSKIKTGTTTETKKTPPTYEETVRINKDLLDRTKDYDTTYKRASVEDDLSDPDLGIVTKGDRAKKIYDFSLTGDEKTYGIKDLKIDEEGFIKEDDTAEYELLYKEYEQGAREYYEATGELLPKEYLSPEEAGKYTSLTFGTGYKGGYKPVLNTENIEWSFAGEVRETGDRTAEFVTEMLGRGGTLDDYDPEELKKMGVDVERAKEIINQLGR